MLCRTSTTRGNGKLQCPPTIYFVLRKNYTKGSLGAVVKLLPCDHEVMGSSPGNSLLQKCRERLRTIDPKWSDPAQAGATCTRLPFEKKLHKSARMFKNKNSTHVWCRLYNFVKKIYMCKLSDKRKKKINLQI
ncbi:hypothetical protein VPH35_028692 [Triticum aestivum]